MSKTCKKLLASALAATMLFSTFVSSLVVSAAATGTLKIGTETITVGTESATVDFTLTFSEAVAAPHDLATIVAKNANEETLTITAAELGEVVYVVDGVEQNTPYIDGIVPDDEVEPPSVSVESTNLTAGKILFGSGVASAADVKVINFTVTFDTTTATVGTYTVTATTDGTDYDEADVVVTTEDGAIVVEEPHTCTAGDLVNNGDGTHDVKCSGCELLYADNVPCEYVDGLCACGAKKPVDECEHVNATLEYSVVDGNCITTKVCPDCDDYSEVISTFANPSIYKYPILQSGLALAFRINTTDVEDYKDIYMEFKKDTYTGDELTGTTDSTLVPNGDTNYPEMHTFLYTGIMAKEMCSNIAVRLYGTDANGNIVLLGDTSYSLLTYIEKYYNGYKNSSNAKNKALSNLLAEMAAYGSYAQDYMKYRTGKKPLDNLDAVITLPTTFDVEGIYNEGFNIYKYPIVGNDISITFRVDKTSVSDYGEDVYAVIDYLDTKDNQLSATTEFADFGLNAANTQYEVYFSTMTAGSAYKKFTIRFMQRVEDGDDVQLAKSVYSLEKYAERQYASATSVATVARALLNYSRAAEAYLAFGS